MPVALHTVSPPDSDGLKLLRLMVPHDIVAPVLVDVLPAVGLLVPALDAHDHVLHIGTQSYHLVYLGGGPDDILGSLLGVLLERERVD